MLFYTLLIVFAVWMIQKLWKTRRILVLSRKLRNKYFALPVIGHGLMFLGTGEDRMKSLQNLGREAIKSKYGITSFWVGMEFNVLICDPVVAGIVTKTALAKSGLIEISRHLMGNGSIFAPVQIWRPRRKILVPIFSPKTLNCYIKVFGEQSTILINCLKSKTGSDTFSIWKNITTYTMDSICETALGIKTNAQGQALHPFLLAFDKYCQLLGARVFQPWLHWDFFYKFLPVFQQAERHRKIIHDFVDDIVRKRKHSLNNEHEVVDLSNYPQNSSQITTFLDLLIKSCDGNDGYTDLEIREEILVLVLAGTDTSAVGTSFAIVMLSRHSNVQEKAYEEVHEIFGDSKRPITLEDLSRLKYIDALLRETLRLYPPVPVITRKHDNDISLPSGITLPAGSCSTINIWGIHRNPQYWGADAEEYNPDRFLNENTESPRSAFMPFSYGPRNCLGYQYAMMSMKVVIANLLRHYKVLPSSDVPSEDLRKSLRLEFNIMMKDVDNFKVRLEHRT